jgi:DNA-binding transcriptional MocR family regulator
MLLEYAPSTGFPHHRAAGARWFAELGLAVEPENVVVTAGAQHALAVVLSAVISPGEVLLTEEYTYPGLKAAAELVGVELIGVPMDSEGPVLESIRSACRQRRVRAVYLNPTLQNPTGYIMPESRRYDIAGLAEQFDFVIIEDELLRPFVPDPPSFVSSFRPDRSLALLSASKVIAAGLRVGFIAAPSAYIARLTDALRSTVLSPPPLTSEILARWLDDGTVANIIARRRQEFEARLKLAREILKGFDVRLTPYSAHVWLILPEPWSTTEFAIQVNRRGAAVAPAELFAVNSRQSSANAVRISLGTAPDRETLTRGLETVAATLRSTPFQGATAI